MFEQTDAELFCSRQSTVVVDIRELKIEHCDVTNFVLINLQFVCDNIERTLLKRRSLICDTIEQGLRNIVLVWFDLLDLISGWTDNTVILLVGTIIPFAEVKYRTCRSLKLKNKYWNRRVHKHCYSIFNSVTLCSFTMFSKLWNVLSPCIALWAAYKLR